MGNTQASNAILAKARAMYGRRLTARNYQELLNCRDLPDLISYLKTRTSYSEALQAANPATTHRAQLETLLRLNLFEQYASLCRYEMNIGHDFYRYFIIRSEVQAISRKRGSLAFCQAAYPAPSGHSAVLPNRHSAKVGVRSRSAVRPL